MRDVCLGTVLLMLIWASVGAQAAQPAQTTGADFLVPFPAHHVIGNIYFVGSKGLGIYLVSTPQGHILINAGLEDSVPMWPRLSAQYHKAWAASFPPDL